MYNILVCDDEKDIVSALEIYLTADGYQVFTAYNGRQAVDILNKEETISCSGHHDAGDERYLCHGENP